jgi:phage tail tube protein FII
MFEKIGAGECRRKVVLKGRANVIHSGKWKQGTVSEFTV